VERLIDVLRRLSSARSLADVMATVRHAARTHTHADGATFVLREGDRVYYADEDAIAPLWKGQRFPLSACISGWAILHRTALGVPDIYADARIPHDAYRATFVKSLVMVPIRSWDPIGAIGTYWATPHEATHEEIDLLSALADSTAVAMENVQLIEQLQQAKQTAEARAAELRDLYVKAEAELQQRQALERELMQKVDELEAFHDVVVGRELKMIDLEKEITRLRERLVCYERAVAATGSPSDSPLRTEESAA